MLNQQTMKTAESVQQGELAARPASILARINEELLSFGPDYLENTHRLTALCGEILGATCALYNCLEDGLLCSLSSWMAPAGYDPKDKPNGHICFDVICKAGNEILIVRDLQNSKYAKTDPNVEKYNLQTYIGRAVKFSGVYLGSLCAVFQSDFDPREEDKLCLSLLASLIGIEEDRRREYEKFLRAERQFLAFAENQEDAVYRWTPEMVLTFANPSFNRFWGSNRKSLVGKRWIELVPINERQATEEFYLNFFNNPRVVSREHEIVRADGEARLFRWTDIPLLNKEGRIVEIQSIIRDITGTKPKLVATSSSRSEIIDDL